MTIETAQLQAGYEVVIGLEVHAQLATASKAFCSDSAAFGAKPNRHVSPVSLGHPGTLPFINKKHIEFAVKLGLATHCQIREYNFFDRKNYFYADLPKGYQITQDAAAICHTGFIGIKTASEQKQIRLNRIHMEEDAGKSIHDLDEANTLIDLNRAGVPLLEIVTEPDLRSGEEAHAFLSEIRRLVRFLGICDGNMEEGSLRCDANISVRKKGETKYGTRCEVKNLNSIKNVQKAIEFEAARQIELLERGETIEQNTLNFDADTGTTSVLRSKEMANDYRYFPEPDLQPIVLTEAYIKEIRRNLPALPEELYEKYTQQLGLNDYEASVLTADHELVNYFEELIKETSNYKAAAHWMMGSIKSYLNTHTVFIGSFLVKPKTIAEVIQLVDEGKISITVAAHQLFQELVRHPEKSATETAAALNLFIDRNEEKLDLIIDQVLQLHPQKVSEYKKGKKGILGMFMGEVMKLSKGKIDPKTANRVLAEKLEK
ncbi:MAG: Asp-tRNA(Asn)/Glu-tRNA(Gln) amidotransferase subunit GatB [Mucilaginibacter sp.]|uniref:Asp-tRNA(Asn)/Glu-tRNA(Gln) amidotransferase subunit GatB n=1 Tax=Mucilaginibacter sp. TaxID=1882438 RepID=UPI0034E563D3